ncbi:hypothetical protein PH213_22505 [Streptomyces sp. SRF1]|uniref:hypothetical protein n=1 Tax=Streptomyces sp. SRF1 TaxID=1549642 RepID=UPI0025B0FB7F|nr:hypothetical protein [Streptomyces sp. SRF1]MDN3057270.1 hypothetical protein [Streptomyces sp. SRF1]
MGDRRRAADWPGPPTTTRARRIVHRSTTATGRPDVVSGAVIVRDDGTPDARPLITWGIGAGGLADGCAVSGRFPRGSATETPWSGLALRRGWAVAVTDYEGWAPRTTTSTAGRSEPG